jgi:hypothetical protein
VDLRETGGGSDKIIVDPASLRDVHYGTPDTGRRCVSFRSAFLTIGAIVALSTLDSPRCQESTVQIERIRLVLMLAPNDRSSIQ